MKITKIRAFAIHFCLSLLVFSSLVAVMYFFWFPGDYFMLDGGWQGLRLIAAVDLVLGPALTLLLFKPGKPKLILDMSMIATLQIAALVYGFYAAYQQQTVALVFAENTFTTMSYQDLKLANRAVFESGFEPVDIELLEGSSPKLIFTESLTGENYGRYLSEILNGKPPMRERTDKYHSLSSKLDELSKYNLNAETLQKSAAFTHIEDIALAENKSLDDFQFFRFKARYGSGIALLDRESGEVTHLVAEETDRS